MSYESSAKSTVIELNRIVVRISMYCSVNNSLINKTLVVGFLVLSASVPVVELPDTAPWTQVAADMDFERYPLDYLRYWKRFKILLANGSVVVDDIDSDGEEEEKSDKATSKRQRSNRQNNKVSIVAAFKDYSVCIYNLK